MSVSRLFFCTICTLCDAVNRLVRLHMILFGICNNGNIAVTTCRALYALHVAAGQKTARADTNIQVRIVLAQSLRIGSQQKMENTSRSISSAPDDRKQALSGRLFLK